MIKMRLGEAASEKQDYREEYAGKGYFQAETPSLKEMVGLDGIYMYDDSSAESMFVLGKLEAIAAEHSFLTGEDSPELRLGQDGKPLGYANGVSYSPDIKGCIDDVFNFLKEKKDGYFGVYVSNGDLKMMPLKALARTVLTKAGLAGDASPAGTDYGHYNR